MEVNELVSDDGFDKVREDDYGSSESEIEERFTPPSFFFGVGEASSMSPYDMNYDLKTMIPKCMEQHLGIMEARILKAMEDRLERMEDRLYRRIGCMLATKHKESNEVVQKKEEEHEGKQKEGECSLSYGGKSREELIKEVSPLKYWGECLHFMLKRKSLFGDIIRWNKDDNNYWISNEEELYVLLARLKGSTASRSRESMKSRFFAMLSDEDNKARRLSVFETIGGITYKLFKNKSANYNSSSLDYPRVAASIKGHPTRYTEVKNGGSKRSRTCSEENLPTTSDFEVDNPENKRNCTEMINSQCH